MGGGEAAVHQQREFRNRRLNPPSLKQKAGQHGGDDVTAAVMAPAFNLMKWS